MKNPAGNDGIYGVVSFKNIAVGIIPIDDDGNTYLVGQYRYPLDEYSWEIPEGGCPQEEEPLACAKRELLEETGIVAKDWTEFLKVHTSNSVCDEVGYVYIARDLEFREAQPEETEDLVVRKLPFNEAFEMAMNNEITDAISVSALLKAKHLLDK